MDAKLRFEVLSRWLAKLEGEIAALEAQLGCIESAPFDELATRVRDLERRSARVRDELGRLHNLLRP